MRPLVDLLVVTFHGGAEGIAALHTGEAAESLGREQRGDLRRWARAVIEAGADVVVGHGPHVLRGIEFYRGVPVVYSLGNFLTYRRVQPRGAARVSPAFSSSTSPPATAHLAAAHADGPAPAPRPVARSGRAPDRAGPPLSAEDFLGTGAYVSGDGPRLAPTRELALPGPGGY